MPRKHSLPTAVTVAIHLEGPSSWNGTFKTTLYESVNHAPMVAVWSRMDSPTRFAASARAMVKAKASSHLEMWVQELWGDELATAARGDETTAEPLELPTGDSPQTSTTTQQS